LDVWAQFFVAPLFREDVVERELDAITNEDARNRTKDGRSSVSIPHTSSANLVQAVSILVLVPAVNPATTKNEGSFTGDALLESLTTTTPVSMGPTGTSLMSGRVQGLPFWDAVDIDSNGEHSSIPSSHEKLTAGEAPLLQH
jgi:hypothetical protein